ncbi:MAG: FAD-binding oxidoreductase [bacterium]
MAERKHDPSRKKRLKEAFALLREAVGGEWVSDSPVTNICYSRDQSIVRAKKPNIVVLPSSTEEVRKVILVANRLSIPVQPYSTGINSYGGCIPERGGILLDMRRMDRILAIDEKNMTMTVQPFVTFGWGQCEGQKRGMRLCNPTAPPTPSVLANFLDKGVGLSSTRYGLGPEHIVNMRVVLPDGEVVDTGSAACPGAGNVCVQGPGPDLGGIFEASLGVFGVVTEMTVQLYHWPRFEHFTGLISEEEDLEPILELMRKLVREDFIEEIFLFQDAYLAMGAAENNEGAEILRKYIPRHQIVLYLAGRTQEELELKKKQLDDFVRRNDAQYVKESFMELFDKALDARKCLKITQQTPRAERLRGSFLIMWFNATFDVLPTLARKYHAILDRELADTDPESGADPFPRECTAVYVQPMEFGRSIGVEFDVFWSPDDPESVKRTMPVGPMVTNMILDHGGWYERTSRAGILQSPRLGTYFQLMKELKNLIDPKNIMNPGRMGLP